MTMSGFSEIAVAVPQTAFYPSEKVAQQLSKRCQARC